MTLANYSIDAGALLRARSIAFNAMDTGSDGYGKQAAEEKYADLTKSCVMVLKACSGQQVDGVTYETDIYDGHEALLIYTPKHKIVCIKLGLSSQEFRPTAIFSL
ncbi:hypothetical protein RLO149_c010970 [Roseobacter litoralis Och 149]|uniref:Uncharacterized protein n=1 Tax=Roseobacter litoralis (strain ATCC 49566 / DSM 6996 / JCM 21268 / NBRC 15278 / OCh 149) TaxID=391595 RepID=F7ZBR2_ROSLO|nr:hypothetical protein RLO149_c010970 [Roseobacter litoralis Och 149]